MFVGDHSIRPSNHIVIMDSLITELRMDNLEKKIEEYKSSSPHMKEYILNVVCQMYTNSIVVLMEFGDIRHMVHRANIKSIIQSLLLERPRIIIPNIPIDTKYITDQQIAWTTMCHKKKMANGKDGMELCLPVNISYDILKNPICLDHPIGYNLSCPSCQTHTVLCIRKCRICACRIFVDPSDPSCASGATCQECIKIVTVTCVCGTICQLKHDLFMGQEQRIYCVVPRCRAQVAQIRKCTSTKCDTKFFSCYSNKYQKKCLQCHPPK